jgi:hypothetical protein
MPNQTKHRRTYLGRPVRTAAVLLAVAVIWGVALGLDRPQDQDVSLWTAESHDNTNFPLIGKHRTVSCRECHLNLVFEGTPTACEACHWERRQDDRYQLRLGYRCGECHTPRSWKNVTSDKWNHEFVTGFPLAGAHRTLDCADCHGEDGFEAGRVVCFDCHAEDYSGVREPDHAAAGFPTRCQYCHGTSRWEGAVFTHAGFVLQGQHRGLNCSDCHRGGQFVGLSTDCFVCHEQDYNEVKNPDHLQLGYPLDCEICHGAGSRGWGEALFSHREFPLKGNHRLAACSQCHSIGQYRGLPSDCISCHADDYNGSENPDHPALGFPAACEICHGDNARTWEGAEFSHSGFKLRGQHKLAQCSDCHTSGQYAGLPSDCLACHKQDFDSAEDPDHAALGFPTMCEFCHGTGAQTWEGAEFTHSLFVLNGQHKLAQCSDCHTSGRYVGLPSSCVSCHRDDYNNAKDPDHQTLNFSTTCQVCHGTGAQTWEGAAFDHAAIWPLQGAHTSLDCSQCHVSSSVPPNACYGCHAQDYDATSDPNHQAAGFPTSCELCHYPSHVFWTQAVFDHQFPINSGKHALATCTDCHTTSNYKEFSCLNCHPHNRTRMDNKHRDVGGYAYNSLACFACHPQGQD